MSFVGAQTESQLGKRLLHQGQGLLSLSGGKAKHHEVIGLTHEAIAVFVKPPIQMMEHDVGQQRTDDASLGRTHRGRFEDTVFHHAGAKELFDEAKEVAVGDLGRHRRQDDRMRQIVEEPLDVGVEDNSITFVVESFYWNTMLISLNTNELPCAGNQTVGGRFLA